MCVQFYVNLARIHRLKYCSDIILYVSVFAVVEMVMVVGAGIVMLRRKKTLSKTEITAKAYGS